MAEPDTAPLVSEQHVHDATITVRLVKSFAFRTVKNLVLHAIDLHDVTPIGLLAIVHERTPRTVCCTCARAHARTPTRYAGPRGRGRGRRTGAQAFKPRRDSSRTSTCPSVGPRARGAGARSRHWLTPTPAMCARPHPPTADTFKIFHLAHGSKVRTRTHTQAHAYETAPSLTWDHVPRACSCH